MKAVAMHMQTAVNSGIFPGAVLLVSHQDKIVFHEAFGLADIGSGQLMQTNSVFDLASLTKPLATALCAMKLVEQRKIFIDQSLGQILPESLSTDKADITIDHLLRHTSGLPAHRPFYEKVICHPEELRQSIMRQFVLQEPVLAKPGKKQIYSDLGYMLLAWVIEKISGCPLDKFAREQIYELAGIDELFFIHTNHQNRAILTKHEKLFVSTEMCPWRKKILRGEVHDDNAWAVGGVDGHAGLFGTASGVWQILVELMHLLHSNHSHYRVSTNHEDKNKTCFHDKKNDFINVDILKKFLAKKDGFDMVAGFDTPSLSGSSTGKYFSSESIGHLGFTGTSFWMDPLKNLIVILLSNRVHPSRENQKIKLFRPEIHNIIAKTLL
ncbi:MAG: beta-lactamase family protein [Desulfamplus sp.]|nr:beta-lactamase family protein [Desulfamplus sp.]